MGIKQIPCGFFVWIRGIKDEIKVKNAVIHGVTDSGSDVSIGIQ